MSYLYLDYGSRSRDFAENLGDATVIYVPSNKDAADTANFLEAYTRSIRESQTNIPILELRDDAPSYSSIALYWPDHEQESIVSGHAIKNYLSRIEPATKGASAALISVFSIVAAFLLAPMVSHWYRWISIPVVTLALLLPVACATCHTGTGLASYSPLMVGTISLVLAAMSFKSDLTVTVRSAVAVLASAAIPAQGYLLMLEPKLCPICLSLTLLLALFATSVVHSLKLGIHAPPAVRVPKVGALALLIIISFFLVRNSAITFGVISDASAETVSETELVGVQLSQFINLPLSTSESVIMVTSSGCGACVEACDLLKSYDISFAEVPKCTVTEEEACFSAGDKVYGIPILVVIDDAGVITYANSGIPSNSVGQERLIRDIRGMLERT